MTKRVMIGTPTMTGDLWAEYQQSLILSMCAAAQAGWEVMTNNLSTCSLISYARAIIAQDFMDSDCDVLFFIDSDIAWEPKAFVSYLEAPLDFMGGAYPIKREGPVAFHIELKEQCISDGRKLLLDTSGVGGGFVKITRSVMEKMQKAYPELKATAPYGGATRELYMLWDTMNVNGVPKGEDLSFCYRWTQIGGKIYVDPDLTFKHYGRKFWTGNFMRDVINKEQTHGNHLTNDNEDRKRPDQHDRHKKRRHDDRPVLGGGTVQSDQSRRFGSSKIRDLERNRKANGPTLIKET